GLDRPRPGKSAFQWMFFVVVHFTGRPVSSETLSPPGPRKRGQSPAVAEVASKQTLNVASTRLIALLLPSAGRWFSLRAASSAHSRPRHHKRVAETPTSVPSHPSARFDTL